MRIISENSEAELARERAMRQVDRALRELTANLMRVTRGAGKVEVDMDKARAIAAERMEAVRRAKMRDLMEREALGEDVTAEKAELQALEPAEVVKDATVPDSLKTLWPTELR